MLIFDLELHCFNNLTYSEVRRFIVILFFTNTNRCYSVVDWPGTSSFYSDRVTHAHNC